ncbi:hypothetical protein GH714_043529 [Hevea brasiliensis]|uniref:Lipoyl synthase N-terminal domain-containing protein n=1 Tax=Hevea brasiliensis TaxID=3981 RepID=A0A6A6K6Y9_HEVBR|nr:hypothetical protein GH714_043529 [Hevea brasiliensis]
MKEAIPGGEKYVQIKKKLRELKLHTVCEEAKCPNLGECWSGGETGTATATIMILGDTCTRGCSVDRDDLLDQGSGHFAQTVQKLKALKPNMLIEALVEELQSVVRDRRANFKQSLDVLMMAKDHAPTGTLTKTSIMLGCGETPEQVVKTMEKVRAAGVDVMTFGQYMRPSKRHMPVSEYITPEAFEKYRTLGMEMQNVLEPCTEVQLHVTQVLLVPNALVGGRKACCDFSPSVTNTYSTATTATTATAVTEIRDDEVTSKKRVNRSPSKLPRKRPYNGERERGIKPPGKGELSSQATTTQRNVGSSRVGRDLGERSGRRSRSPATRKTSGGVSRGGRAGGSPANVTGKSGGRRGEAGSGVKKEEKREENDSVLMQQQQGNEPVSLENPLLSFECFIFV